MTISHPTQNTSKKNNFFKEAGRTGQLVVPRFFP